MSNVFENVLGSVRQLIFHLQKPRQAIRNELNENQIFRAY